VWQKLQDQLHGENFVVITVAMESRGNSTAAPIIRKSGSTYPSLIDRNHLVADLYNMTNVPQAVWIDEAGKIVRPVEVPGMAITLKARQIRKHYMDAIKDWVKKGDESEYAFSEEDARAHLAEFTEDVAQAHAYFHLGQQLWNDGNREEGGAFLQRATELNPDSWNFFRQMKNLEKLWGSAGPGFFARAARYRRAGKTYYPLPDMPGLDEI
jgi:hypothetical protein